MINLSEQALRVNLIDEQYDKAKYILKNTIKSNSISEDLLLEFIDKVPNNIFRTLYSKAKVSQEFVLKHSDKLDMFLILRNNIFSESFIEELISRGIVTSNHNRVICSRY